MIYNLTYGNNNMSECTCGRSPTDNCVGWHNLSEEAYQEKKIAYEARQADKRID